MSVLASAFNIGDTQAHLNVPLSGVGSGNFNVKIDDELLHVGGVENRTGLVLAMSVGATANHAQGATVTPVLDAFTTDATSPFASGGPGGETNVYVQPDDPGAVGAGKLWVDTTEDVTGQRVQIRNDTDEAWFELFDGYRTPAEMSISTVDQQLRISRRSADGVFETVEIRLEDTGGGLRIFTRDADGLQFNEFEISNDGYGADVKDEMGTIRAGHLGSAGGSGSSDAVWEWRIKDSGDVEKASFRLDETGIHFDGVVPEVPASPTEQDIVDALLALGLVTQAA